MAKRVSIKRTENTNYVTIKDDDDRSNGIFSAVVVIILIAIAIFLVGNI